jgi:hypothetical protein
MSGSNFWSRYFDSFEGTGSNQGGSSALALALFLPTLVMWVAWHTVAWIVRLVTRR